MIIRENRKRYKGAVSLAEPPVQTGPLTENGGGNGNKAPTESFPQATLPVPSFEACPVEIRDAGFEIGHTLKALRKAKRLTQEEVAAKAGVARTTIAKLECGIFKSLSVPRLESIARVLGIDLQALLIKAHSLGEALALRTQVNKVEFSLEYPEEGFRIVSFVPRSQEFFFGKIEIKPQKTAPSAKLPHPPFIYVHVLEGKIVLSRLGAQVVLKPGDCHMIPGEGEYELYNPDLLKTAASLFITHPSFLVS